MIVCGIDPSLSQTGLVFFNTKTNVVYTARVKLKKEKGFAPLLDLASRIETYIKRYKPKIISIEEPFVFRGRINGAMRVFYLHALLRKIAYDNNATLYEYAPLAWKKKFTGSGGSGKGQVRWTARTRYRRNFCTHDEADAFGIMYSALIDYKKAKRKKHVTRHRKLPRIPSGKHNRR